MKLSVLCDCDDNKVCTGNFDGKPMWHYKSAYHKAEALATKALDTFNGRSIPQSEWTDWMKDEAYKQNSD